MGGFPGYNQSKQTWTKIRPKPCFLLELELLLHTDIYAEFPFKPSADLNRKAPHQLFPTAEFQALQGEADTPQGMLWWGAAASPAHPHVPVPHRQGCSARGHSSRALCRLWVSHTCLDALTQTPGRVFPVAMGSTAMGNRQSLPQLQPLKGAACLPRALPGPQPCPPRLGEQDLSGEHRCLPEEWQCSGMAALGQRVAAAPFPCSPAADSLRGYLHFPVLAVKEGAPCSPEALGRAQGVHLGEQSSPSLAIGAQDQLARAGARGKERTSPEVACPRCPCQGDKSFCDHFYTGSSIHTFFPPPNRNLNPKKQERPSAVSLASPWLLYTRSSGREPVERCRSLGPPWDNKARNQLRGSAQSSALRKPRVSSAPWHPERRFPLRSCQPLGTPRDRDCGAAGGAPACPRPGRGESGEKQPPPQPCSALAAMAVSKYVTKPNSMFSLRPADDSGADGAGRGSPRSPGSARPAEPRGGSCSGQSPSEKRRCCGKSFGLLPPTFQLRSRLLGPCPAAWPV